VLRWGLDEKTGTKTPSVCFAATSPGSPGEAHELSRGFALGFGVGGGGWFVFEDVGEAGGGEGAGLGLDDGLAGGADALDCFGGLFEGFGFEDGCEFDEGEAVDLAHVEGGEGGVGEVFEEIIGKCCDCS